jgi:adenylate kinase family enzyme
VQRRVHLIGGSGAGKTTLGRQVASALGVPFIDLDDLFWEPGWREVGHAELARRLLPRLEREGWVVAGNYHLTTEAHVWPRITDLVVLDLPFPLMMRRCLMRTLRRGLTGEPCCNGNRESVWRLFNRDGVVRYLARTWRKRHRRYAGLAQEAALAHARVTRLTTPAEVADFAAAFEARR